MLAKGDIDIVRTLSVQCRMEVRTMKAKKVRTDRLEIRLEPGEKEGFQMAAEAAGVPLSAWIRERLRRIARQELEDLGESIPFSANRRR